MPEPMASASTMGVEAYSVLQSGVFVRRCPARSTPETASIRAFPTLPTSFEDCNSRATTAMVVSPMVVRIAETMMTNR